MSHVRFAAAFLVLVAVGQGRAGDRVTVQRALRSFDAAPRAKFMLTALHPGATDTNHKCVAVVGVNDPSGKPVPGHFCLRYQFSWSTSFGDDTTSVDLLFDDLGRLHEINNERTTAIVNQPYVLANGAIQVVGALVQEAFKDRMSAEDRKFVQGCIDNPNARGLMKWVVQLEYNVLGK